MGTKTSQFQNWEKNGAQFRNWDCDDVGPNIYYIKLLVLIGEANNVSSDSTLGPSCCLEGLDPECRLDN